MRSPDAGHTPEAATCSRPTRSTATTRRSARSAARAVGKVHTGRLWVYVRDDRPSGRKAALLAAHRAAHEEGADDEDDEEVPAGEAAGGDPERRQRGPEQQRPARGPVPADQVEPQGEARASKGQVHGVASGHHRPALTA